MNMHKIKIKKKFKKRKLTDLKIQKKRLPILTLLYLCLFECASTHPSWLILFILFLICMVWKYLICMLILTFEPAAGFMLYFLFC